MRIFRFKEGFVKSNVFQLGLIASIYWMSLGVLETVWAIYIEGLVGSASTAGFVISFLIAIGVATAMLAPKLLSKVRESRVYSLSMLGMVVSYIVFALTSDFAIFLAFAVLVVIFEQLRISAFGIIFRDESGDEELDQNEGLMYMMSNIGYLFGPLIAGYFSEAMGIQPIFVLVAVLMALVLLRFRQVGIRDINHGTEDYPIWKNLSRLGNDVSLLKAYILNGGLNTWWAIAYVYVPIMVVDMGYDIGWVGLVIFAMILPTILLEYPAMKKAKKYGYHNYFFIGYALLGLVSIALSAFNGIEQIIALFFVAGMASGILEPVGETYFFRLVGKREEENLYPPFMTSIGVFYSLSVFALAVVIGIASFNVLFLAAGALLFTYALIGRTIKRVDY